MKSGRMEGADDDEDGSGGDDDDNDRPSGYEEY